ncbi:MAG: hypothetical protein JJE23_02035 [Thermoleophilia bacterium]|nr:hypothetical protein [Thermoleophilia bacterium]
MRLADRLGGGFAEADVSDLAGLDLLGQRPDGLLDRSTRVDAVLVIEIDVVEAEPLQRSVDRAAHILGAAVDRAIPMLVEAHAELGRDHDLVATSGERFAEQLLVITPAVHLGGVEEAHTELDRAVERGDRLRLVPLTVEAGHSHAAEADLRYLESVVAECSLVHRHLPSLVNS